MTDNRSGKDLPRWRKDEIEEEIDRLFKGKTAQEMRFLHLAFSGEYASAMWSRGEEPWEKNLGNEVA